MVYVFPPLNAHVASKESYTRASNQSLDTSSPHFEETNNTSEEEDELNSVDFGAYNHSSEESDSAYTHQQPLADDVRPTESCSSFSAKTKASDSLGFSKSQKMPGELFIYSYTHEEVRSEHVDLAFSSSPTQPPLSSEADFLSSSVPALSRGSNSGTNDTTPDQDAGPYPDNLVMEDGSCISPAEFTSRLDQILTVLAQDEQERSLTSQNQDDASHPVTTINPALLVKADPGPPYSPPNQNESQSPTTQIAQTEDRSTTLKRSRSPYLSVTRRQEGHTPSPYDEAYVPTIPNSPQAEPPAKRAKIASKCLAAQIQKPFLYLFSEPASLRRARSLGSDEASLENIHTKKATQKQGSDPLADLPIIAPPRGSQLVFLLRNPEQAAEARIHSMLQKENLLREEDGLDSTFIKTLNAHPEKASLMFGIDAKLRRRVVFWIIQLQAELEDTATPDLMDELSHGENTKFHAAILFSRYFFQLRIQGDPSQLSDSKESRLLLRARTRITFELGLACLALAVKFNRDVLMPLYPIFTQDYAVVAPCPSPTLVQDLEIAQRDVLEAVRFELSSVSPAAYMEELHACLPTLRKLLDFKGGWKAATGAAWLHLQAALLEPDVLRFSTACLSGICLAFGVVEALVKRYRLQDTKKKHRGLARQPSRDADDERGDGSDSDSVADDNEDYPPAEAKYQRRAERAAKGVAADMRAVLNISKVGWRECMNWMNNLKDDDGRTDSL